MPTIPLDQITILRDERQRRELSDIDELAASLADIGLINPIVIDEANILIAGERRLTAAKSLGWLEIEVRYFNDLTSTTKFQIELEENIRRSDLTWTERVDAIAAYHDMRKQDDSTWTVEATAEALNMPRPSVHEHLLVHNHAENNLVAEAPKFSTALNAARRIESRAAAEISRGVDTQIDSLFAPAEEAPLDTSDTSVPSPSPFDIKNANFLEWVKTYTGEPFNLIHCDFPYGVNVGDKVGQSGAKVTGQYADDEETYFTLLETLCEATETIAAPSAHLMFWFSMDYYTATLDALTQAGWRVNPFPLIWYKSNNRGILPDANRGPRRIYETAFMASRGDRFVVRAKSNVAASPTDNELHQAQKPLPMLDHFFQMFVDEYTTILDPTCGSGNAIRAAAERGAASGLGLELLPEFAKIAQANLDEIAP